MFDGLKQEMWADRRVVDMTISRNLRQETPEASSMEVTTY